jgi:hypothetical protein
VQEDNVKSYLLIAFAMLGLLAGVACDGNDDDKGSGGSGGSIGGNGGTGGTGGSGGTGGFAGSGPYGDCEGREACWEGATCQDNVCFQAECGVCEPGQPGCDGGFCECEPAEVGGTCVPDDFGDLCTEHADQAACTADDACRWAVAGCGETKSVTGCFPKEDCGRGWCGSGKVCTYVALDGCVGSFLCL